MPHAVVVLICRVIRANLIKTVTASEFLYFFFLHAESTHALLAGDAEVHLIADEQAGAATLIVHIWSLIRGQLVHRAHFSP